MVAIKVMDLENISSSFEDILQEVQTMRLAEDPNILHLYCSFVHSDQLWLVTEFMDKGSCVRLMSIGKSLHLGEGMSEDCVSYVLGEVVKGLSYLHNQGQIHRDIKSGNILLNSQGRVKLADFGVSGWTVAKGTRVQAVKTFVGTPCFMAPEVMEQAGGYDFRADIWSLGITALELAKGYAPYAPLPPMRVLIKTIEEEPPTLKSYPHDKQLFETGAPYSAHFEDFYRRCLQKVPKQRPKAEELLKHKLFKACDKSAVMAKLLCFVESVGVEKRQEEEVGSVAAATAEFESATLDPVTTSATSATTEESEPRRVMFEDTVFSLPTDANSPHNPTNFPTAPVPITSTTTTTTTSTAPAAYVPGTSWVFDAEDDKEEEGKKERVLEALGEGKEPEQGLDDFLEDFEND